MPPAEEFEVPGLQRERTALAWERTGSGFVIVSLLFLRATQGSSWLWQVPSTAVLLFGCAFIVVGYRRNARAGPQPERGAFAGTVLLRAVGFVTVAFSLLALLLIVVRYA